MEIFLFVLLCLLMLAYMVLLEKYTKAKNQLFKTQSDFTNLKLLNKLKVDWNGNPIYYDKID